MRADSCERPAVLLVANYPSDVGYAWWLMENFWSLIASSAAARGHRCILAYPRVASVPQVILDSPAELVEFKFQFDDWRSILRGLSFIRKHSIESVYLTDWPYYHFAYSLWRAAGVRQIVVHDHTPGDRPALKGLRGFTKNAIHSVRLFSATTYVAVSNYIATRLQENGRIPRERCTVVTNGIRCFARSAARAPSIRQELGLPDDAVLIAMVSRATRYKNLDFAINCMAELLQYSKMRERVFAIHCGSGPDLEAFIAMTSDLGISENVRFLGHRDDVREILCAADIAFHPSRGEAMSLAILEFMCAELAVVTSDLPSVCTALEPGSTGLTYAHDDLASAVSALRRVIDDPTLRTALGRAAGAACRRSFRIEATNQAFLERVIPRLIGSPHASTAQ